MEPYKFQKIKFNYGILNNSVDATYIIHLEGNGRYDHIFFVEFFLDHLYLLSRNFWSLLE